MLAKPTWPKYKGAAKDGVEILCKALNLGPNDYRMGKTKVFIRSPNTVNNSSSLIPSPPPMQCHYSFVCFVCFVCFIF